MITIVMLHISMSNLKGESSLTINFFNHSFNTRLFFFLSGMVVALGGANFPSWKDVWNFGVKKTKTLLLPFVVWSAFIMPYIYERSDIHDFYFVWICRDTYISVAAISAIPLYVIVFAVALPICVLSSYIADGIKKIPYMSFFLFGDH